MYTYVYIIYIFLMDLMIGQQTYDIADLMSPEGAIYKTMIHAWPRLINHIYIHTYI